jgi:AcrR family transcriptional regulator
VPRQSVPRAPAARQLSTREQIVLVAEWLFADRGLDGVSLRQIGAQAGSGNHSAVQYHFGSKRDLVRAVFAQRLPYLTERRRILVAQHRPSDLRAWVECYVLPILEQGEQEDSHYLSFVAMLQQAGQRQIFEGIPAEFRGSIETFHQQLAALLDQLPDGLRRHRISQALAFSVHASADRERSRAAGRPVLPFALHVADLLDGLVGFLEAPASNAALAALADAVPDATAFPVLV